MNAETIMLIILSLVCIKSFTVGSDFSFHLWFKYGKRYTTWYFNREEFSDGR